MNPRLRPLLILAALFLLAACVSKAPAPVIETRLPPTVAPPPTPPTATTSPPTVTGGEVVLPRPVDPSKIHVIQRGETLGSIAFAHGLDYRELAAWNNIVNPNLIKVGDTLRLTAPTAPPGPAPAGPSVPPPPLPHSLPAGTPLPSVPPVQAQPGDVVTTPLPIPATPVPEGKPLANTTNLKVEPKATKVPYSDRALAEANAPPPPVIAPPGTAPPTVIGAPPAITNPSAVPAPPAPTAVLVPTTPTPTLASGDPAWAWPLAGKPRIIANFSDANKGIDLAGTRGTPVLAAAAGKVTYTGSQLRAYGRLVLVQHANGWISAYAHNDKILVNEGDEVARGQKIAEMGSSDADQVKLHFEIRKQGRPQDPMKLLPAQ